MEDYIKCELMGGGFPSVLNTFSNLFIVAVHYTYQYMLCIVAIVDCTPCCPLQSNQNIPYLVLLLTAPIRTFLWWGGGGGGVTSVKDSRHVGSVLIVKIGRNHH